MDPSFLEWVEPDRGLEPSSIVVEWVEGNPFAHSNPNYASVGQYIFSSLDEWVTRDA
jgi:hypothetical protein